MEQIIAALITALVTLVVALIAVGPALKLLSNRLDHRADNLARDHKDIQAEMQRNIGQVASMTSFLRDARLQDEARRELLKGQEVDVQKVIDTILELQDRNHALSIENAELKAMNLRLVQQLSPLSHETPLKDFEDELTP